MSRILTVFAIVSALAGTAVAGRRIPAKVVVDLAAHRASGALGTAHNSPDRSSHIGCGVSYDAVNGRNNLNCSAVDDAGRNMSCASQRPELVQIALGISSDSYVEIVWDGPECTNVIVVNASYNEPKK